jgi:hypothetical protein
MLKNIDTTCTKKAKSPVETIFKKKNDEKSFKIFEQLKSINYIFELHNSSMIDDVKGSKTRSCDLGIF